MRVSSQTYVAVAAVRPADNAGKPLISVLVKIYNAHTGSHPKEKKVHMVNFDQHERKMMHDEVSEVQSKKYHHTVNEPLFYLSYIRCTYSRKVNV